MSSLALGNGTVQPLLLSSRGGESAGKEEIPAPNGDNLRKSLSLEEAEEGRARSEKFSSGPPGSERGLQERIVKVMQYVRDNPATVVISAATIFSVAAYVFKILDAPVDITAMAAEFGSGLFIVGSSLQNRARPTGLS